jgi:hypothetical protein
MGGIKCHTSSDLLAAVHICLGIGEEDKEVRPINQVRINYSFYTQKLQIALRVTFQYEISE